jgi:hypothetical protein
MADSPAFPGSNGETGNDTGAAPDRGSTVGTPRWVKVFGTVVALLILLLVVLLLLRGGPLGGHGPGRHSSSGDLGGQTSSSNVTAAHPRSAGLGDHASPEAGLG